MLWARWSVGNNEHSNIYVVCRVVVLFCRKELYIYKSAIKSLAFYDRIKSLCHGVGVNSGGVLRRGVFIVLGNI